MSNALVVAGSEWQLAIVKFLQSKGYTVYIVNPFDTETTRTADHHFKVDILHLDTIIEWVRSNNLQFDFITSDISETAVMPVAKLSEALGLPSNTPTAVNFFLNKKAMYDLAICAGIGVPPYQEVSSAAEAESFISQHGYPIVVKPVDATASRGFFMLPGPVENLSERITASLNFSRSKKLLVQKCVSGTEVTVEGLCSGGVHRTVAFSSKDHFRPGIASALKYKESLVPEHIREKIEKANDLFVKCSSLQFGITHAEYIYDGDDVYFIEIACRGGGCGISTEILPWVTGWDIYDIMLSNLINKPVDITKLTNLRRPALLHFFEFPEGEVKKVICSNIGDIECVSSFRLNLKERDYLRPATTDSHRHGAVIILGEVWDNIQTCLADVYNKINIEVQA